VGCVVGSILDSGSREPLIVTKIGIDGVWGPLKA